MLAGHFYQNKLAISVDAIYNKFNAAGESVCRLSGSTDVQMKIINQRN